MWFKMKSLSTCLVIFIQCEIKAQENNSPFIFGSPDGDSQLPVPPQFPPRFRLPVNNIARCQQIMNDNPYDSLAIMRQEGIISDREDVSFRRTLFSTIIIGTGSVHFGCAPRQDFTNCSRDACFHLRYRSMDGTCNNFDKAFLGAAATPYIRYQPATYDDGIGALTGSRNGNRPSARDITKNVLSTGPQLTHPTYNSLLMQFGQFIAHDVSKTANLPREKCSTCKDIEGHCAPIPIVSKDPAYACPQLPCCLLFTRASPVCGTGSSAQAPRQQLNENTAFLDASAVYGSSVPDRDRLKNGMFMRTTFFNNTSYLPFNHSKCSRISDCNVTFDAGDSRFVIFSGLAAFHTLMLREHNRLAQALSTINPHWSRERVFQEARKIVGAELQVITYREWLPKILGESYNHYVPAYGRYRPEVDPSIAAEFTYAAMRFGHGMIVETYDRLNASDTPIPQGPMKFEEGVLKPHKFLFEGGIEALLRGMLLVPVKRPQRIAPLVTTRLFGSQDLASISLQRGRETGIASYNDMRQFCGLNRAITFEDLRGEIRDPNMRRILQEEFGNPDFIDLYVGGLLEDPVTGAMVGPTLACIIGDQFARIRDGDRFWYENPTTFFQKQLAELDKVSIARLLCDNMENFNFVTRDAFELPNESNRVNCKDLPSMDLNKWLD